MSSKNRFKRSIKILKSTFQNGLNDPEFLHEHDREETLKMIPIYNKVLKNIETEEEARMLILYLLSVSVDHLEIRFTREYLQKRHDINLFKVDEEGLTSDDVDLVRFDVRTDRVVPRRMELNADVLHLQEQGFRPDKDLLWIDRSNL